MRLMLKGSYEHRWCSQGKQVICQMGERRAGDVAECYANPQKAKAVLHWAARRTLDDMCASAWHFQQSINTEKS